MHLQLIMLTLIVRTANVSSRDADSAFMKHIPDRTGSGRAGLYLWTLAVLQDLFVGVFGGEEASAASVQVL